MPRAARPAATVPRRRVAANSAYSPGMTAPHNFDGGSVFFVDLSGFFVYYVANMAVWVMGRCHVG